MNDRMKRKIGIVLCVLFALFFSLAPLRIVKTWAVEGDPFTEIETAEELKALASDSSRWGGNFKLTADINLNGSADDPWTPIGNNNNSTHFTGIFDGGNHTISGLYIETTGSYQGLFGYVSNGTIKNLKVQGTVIGYGYVGGIVGFFDYTSTENGVVENCSFAGTAEGGGLSVGGIVGYNHNGTVKECRNSGTVHCGSMYAGGIVGQNEANAIVIDCENTGTVSLIGEGTTIGTAGGIVGVNNTGGKIINCSNKGNIGKERDRIIGGIVGSNSSSSVTQCRNTGAVTGSDYIGGIAGSNNSASVTQCCNTGDVSGSQNIGGIAGLNTAGASIEQCYNLNTVSGTSNVGGLVGQSEGKATVTNCYNKAAVSGTSNVGGLVGKNYDGSSSKNATLGKITNCYNRGTVKSNASNSGGVVGLNKIGTSEGTVKNCYYLEGTAKGGIAGSDAVGKAEAKTTAKFNSGEVCWLLQKGNTVNGVWGQELVKSTMDAFPLLISLPEGASGAPDDTRTGDKAVPIVARISFFVPDESIKDHKQLAENGSNEYYIQYSNENGEQGDGIGRIKMPTHTDHEDVPEKGQDDGPIVWLVNSPTVNRKFDTVLNSDIIWDGSKYNEIYLYVKWEFATEQLLGCLTIKATGGQPNESFLYHITGTAKDGTEIDLTVSVKSGSFTGILVPLGEYTVTEISDWSWRYEDGVPTGDSWRTTATTIEEDRDSTYGGQEKTVTYSHERNHKNWLGGENFQNDDFEQDD